jgi:hypothetical protein
VFFSDGSLLSAIDDGRDRQLRWPAKIDSRTSQLKYSQCWPDSCKREGRDRVGSDRINYRSQTIPD